jgi:hypothetical protein
VNRICGSVVESVLPDNYAIDMPIWGTQQNGEHGETITVGQAKLRSTYTDIDWKFGENLSAPWRISEGVEYPELFF